MAVSNHERVGKALELLKTGLGPFVEREIKSAMESKRLDGQKLRGYADDPVLANKPIPDWDVAGLLKLMWETWNEVFRKILGPAERSLVGELRGHRNKWAHQESFSSDDAYRALDSVGRLLVAVSAPQAEDLERMKMELLRVRFDEQTRSERRKQAGGSHRKRRTGGKSQALARGRHPAQGRRQRALPAGRVRRRPLAGSPRRGHR
jgi:hypothetical protein